MTENKEEDKIIEPEVVGEITKDDKQMAMLAHILALPCSFIAPLLILVVKKDNSEFIEDQAKESLNFQISIFIVFALIFTTAILCAVTVIFLPVVMIFDMIFCIIAGVKANEGVKYRYPVNIRFLN